MARSKSPREQTLFDLPDQGAGLPPARRTPSGDNGTYGGGIDTAVPLHEAAQARYLNYALSVITSRALPASRGEYHLIAAVQLISPGE